MFDMAILSFIFDIRPKAIVDTLSMARAIHGTEVGGSLAKLAEYYALGVKGTEVLNALGKRRIDFNAEDLAKYGEYCKNDVVLTMDLFKNLSADFPPTELRLIDLTIRMFTEPSLELDKELLVAHLESVKKKKEDLMKLVEANRDQIMSNDQFAEALKALGATPPTKISPATGRETWAFAKTDEGFKALLEHENGAVQALVSARLGIKSTIEETRTQRFIEIADRGLLPIPLRY
jgi:DNA polymerase